MNRPGHRRPVWQTMFVRVRPWAISLACHLALLLFLAWWVLPTWSGGSPLFLAGRFEDAAQRNDVALEVLPAADPEPSAKSETISASQSDASTPDPMPLPKIETADRPVVPVKSTDVDTMAESPAPVLATADLADGAGLHAADGVAQAMETVQAAIKGQLTQGDLLVAWLFDSSTSLKENRAVMANQASAFFNELKLSSRSKSVYQGQLYGAVIAYGRRHQEIQRPTKEMTDVLAAMRRLPVDSSGYENVMGSIQDTLRQYRDRRVGPDRMMIVILTDESGDDLPMLENTIQHCRHYRVAVHVLGATSVFGREITRQVIDGRRVARVRKGPETPMPETFLAGFWYQNEPPTDRRHAKAFPWCGGIFREAVPSGFGTYALSRLAVETGGGYTLFDRKDPDPAIGQYDLIDSPGYHPSLQSAEDYSREVRTSSLRQYVFQAVQISLDPNFPAPPPAQLPSAYYRVDPFRMDAPEDHLRRVGERNQYVQSLDEVTRSLIAARDRLLVLERNFEAVQDWQPLWDAESSPRWKAAFDLTRGRVLAWIVRTNEYLAATRSISTGAMEVANHVRWIPTDVLQVPLNRPLAGQARKHLDRCVRLHAGTPWATFADWELQIPMGTRVQVR
ncbi:vWA domain-containing protein [Crateriforma conspicua]|uniref:vWA domain-containing protein n=1 Tax=Crateriforma conspicua TaxID=2527996 RepID=UPI0011A67AA0|nr:vWA domain-containing protein [Crateriforma conspicua]